MGCGGGEITDHPGNTKVAPAQGQIITTDDEDFDGPLKKRSCTDIIFLILFFGSFGGMGYIAYRGYQTGDPFRIIYGMDSWGNTCNRINTDKITNVSMSGRDMRGYSKVYYYNFLAVTNPTAFPIKTTVVCTKMCPNETLSTLSGLQTWAQTYDVQLCRYDVAYANYKNGSDINDVCPILPILPHLDIINRCVPKILESIGKSAVGVLNTALNALKAQCQDSGDFFQKAASDVTNTWQEISYLCAISAGVAFIMVVLMRFIACIVIWTLVTAFALLSIGCTGYCWLRWYFLKLDYEALPKENQFEEDAARIKLWFKIAIPVSCVAAIILFVLLVLRKRIALVVQLFREASKAMVSMPLLLIQPLWTMLVLLIWLGGLGYIFLYVETGGDPVVDSDGRVEYVPDKILWYMKWAYLFGVLWHIQFIFACHQVTIAGAIATWYFTRDRTKMWFPIFTSIGRLIRYHLGSVAFGAFLIALIQFIRIVLGYIQNKLRGRAGPFVDFFLKCLQFCLWCFEKFIKFLNKNAYIMIAIYGYNFCRAAQRGFSLIVSNALRVAAINSVGTFVLLLGELGVVAIVVLVGLEFYFKDDATLCYIWVPLSLVGIGSFIVSHTFFSVYSMTIDTIFLCFAEDSEKNNGLDKPYYMSMGLMEYVENSRAAIAAEENRAEQRAAEYYEQQRAEKEGRAVSLQVPLQVQQKQLVSVSHGDIQQKAL